MVEAQREVLRRFVYENLPDRDFQQAFTAVTSSGERPIVIALREDPMSDVLRQAVAAGGAANVAVSLLNGVIVLSMTSSQVTSLSANDDPDDTREMLTGDCTVGVFLQRMLGDAPEGGEVDYNFRVSARSNQVSHGRAQALFAGSS